MIRTVVFILFAFVSQHLVAQIVTPPSGDNQKSVVTQYIGPVAITISYSSPDVHGPNGEDRKGHIWGELAHAGFIDQGYGTSKAAPWRAGANENTIITFSHDVKIDGKELKAGTYGLFLDVEKQGPWTWIFSKNSTSWGSYYYDAAEDALRVQTTAVDAPYTEWLTFGFDDRQPTSAISFLQWENKRVPFKIEVPNVNMLYVEKMREQLRGTPLGFDAINYIEAARFCARNKVNLPEALTWADVAISAPYIGKKDFNSLQCKSEVLLAMGKDAEAYALVDAAIKEPTASMNDIHQYGRSLLIAGKAPKALEVFKANRQLHPEDSFMTYVGLARGYTATGDNKNAIKNWELAIKNLPADQKNNAPLYEAELKKLKG